MYVVEGEKWMDLHVVEGTIESISCCCIRGVREVEESWMGQSFSPEQLKGSWSHLRKQHL